MTKFKFSNRFKVLFIYLFLILVIGLISFIMPKKTAAPTGTSISNTNEAKPESDNSNAQSASNKKIIPPVPDPNFTNRITKKPFGIRVTPDKSPVQPEKFTGYHTAVDIEYGESTEEISIFAITDGEIILARTAQGYGGVMIIRHAINGKFYNIVYGHLDPKSFTQKKTVSSGEKIGILGEGFTDETDFERKHLHFGIIDGTRIDLLGYVQNEKELSGWIDPLTFYK